MLGQLLMLLGTCLCPEGASCSRKTVMIAHLLLPMVQACQALAPPQLSEGPRVAVLGLLPVPLVLQRLLPNPSLILEHLAGAVLRLLWRAVLRAVRRADLRLRAALMEAPAHANAALAEYHACCLCCAAPSQLCKCIAWARMACADSSLQDSFVSQTSRQMRRDVRHHIPGQLTWSCQAEEHWPLWPS